MFNKAIDNMQKVIIGNMLDEEDKFHRYGVYYNGKTEADYNRHTPNRTWVPKKYIRNIKYGS